MKSLRRVWFAYSDWVRRMTVGERAILVAALLICLSVWMAFLLTLLVLEKGFHL